MKRCPQCKIYKPHAEFHKDKSNADGFQAACKSCKFKKRVRYRNLNPERVREVSRTGHQRRKEAGYSFYGAHWEEYRDKALMKRYGINHERYLEMYREQGGKCKICEVHKPKLHVDHNHKSGVVRGLLCCSCNLGIGYLRDDPALLLAGISYLKNGGIKLCNAG